MYLSGRFFNGAVFFLIPQHFIVTLKMSDAGRRESIIYSVLIFIIVNDATDASSCEKHGISSHFSLLRSPFRIRTAPFQEFWDGEGG